MEKTEEIKQNEADLLSICFQEDCIKKALQLTNDKERVVELILKFEEEAYNLLTPAKDPTKNTFKALEVIKQTDKIFKFL